MHLKAFFQIPIETIGSNQSNFLVNSFIGAKICWTLIIEQLDAKTYRLYRDISLALMHKKLKCELDRL